MIRNFFHNVVFVLAVLSYFTLSAQQVDGQPDRDAVVIDYFFTARGVSPAYAERVRSWVVEGFLRRGRHRGGGAALGGGFPHEKLPLSHRRFHHSVIPEAFDLFILCIIR